MSAVRPEAAVWTRACSPEYCLGLCGWITVGNPPTRACGAAAGSARTCVAQAGSLADVVREQNAKNKVVVYSKSYCPYCAQVAPCQP